MPAECPGHEDGVSPPTSDVPLCHQNLLQGMCMLVLFLILWFCVYDP